MMPVLLRGHHFLCILTYRGKGYSDAFVANMSAKVAAIRNGQPVQLVEGPDDICNGFTDACREACDHDCNARETSKMDLLAAEAVSTLLGRPLMTPAPLAVAEIAALRVAYKQNTIRTACADCTWKEFCDGIAEDGFSGTGL
jgi:hypothetical protein